MSAVAVADFNRDGDPDLAVTNVNLSRVSVLLGSAGGRFTAPTNFAVGSTQTSVVAADFNGDGKPDLAATKSATNRAVGRAAEISSRPIWPGEGIGQADDDHALVQQGGDEAEDGAFLAAVLGGRRGEHRADLADQLALRPEAAGLVPEIAHLAGDRAEARAARRR